MIAARNGQFHLWAAAVCSLRQIRTEQSHQKQASSDCINCSRMHSVNGRTKLKVETIARNKWEEFAPMPFSRLQELEIYENGRENWKVQKVSLNCESVRSSVPLNFTDFSAMVGSQYLDSEALAAVDGGMQDIKRGYFYFDTYLKIVNFWVIYTSISYIFFKKHITNYECVYIYTFLQRH